MGSSLYWRPILNGRGLANELKNVLTKSFQFPRVFNRDDVNYLRGLSDSNVLGAALLIEMIEKHEEIELYIEY